MEKKIFSFVSGQFIQDNRVETLMLLKAKDYISCQHTPILVCEHFYMDSSETQELPDGGLCAA